MLESLKVSSFKSLSSLELEQLERVNLIIGKNNVGKTSLLDAVYVYFSRASASSLERILLDRDEFAHSPTEPVESARSHYAINSLFSGRRGFEDGGASFDIGPLRGASGDELTVRLARLKPSPS